MAQSAISFSLLVSKYSFHIINFDIGFEINACQPEILILNLNEQFRTALHHCNRNVTYYIELLIPFTWKKEVLPCRL